MEEKSETKYYCTYNPRKPGIVYEQLTTVGENIKEDTDLDFLIELCKETQPIEKIIIDTDIPQLKDLMESTRFYCELSLYTAPKNVRVNPEMEDATLVFYRSNKVLNDYTIESLLALETLILDLHEKFTLSIREEDEEWAYKFYYLITATAYSIINTFFACPEEVEIFDESEADIRFSEAIKYKDGLGSFPLDIEDYYTNEYIGTNHYVKIKHNESTIHYFKVGAKYDSIEDKILNPQNLYVAIKTEQPFQASTIDLLILYSVWTEDIVNMIYDIEEEKHISWFDIQRLYLQMGYNLLGLALLITTSYFAKKGF